MQFVYQSLTWGFLLALLPLLIHLINMMRHRRVHWAAMEFLLQSYQKHRRWVWLKQLLLLLARMAAIALAVGMLAQWVTRGEWLDMFSGTATHHYVILDDSFSMSERVGGTTAFDRALNVLRQIGSEASTTRSGGQHALTVLRTSRVMQHSPSATAGELEELTDLNAEVIDSEFSVLWEEKQATMDVTQMSGSPLAALRVIETLSKVRPDDRQVVYLLTDFRTGQWGNAVEIRKVLRQIEKVGIAIRLVNCASESSRNLAITRLEPTKDTRAAGVPLFMNLDITNFGAAEERNVQLAIRTRFYGSTATAQANLREFQGQLEEIYIPPVESIAPGQTVTRRVQVYFSEAGQHVVEAELSSGDSIATDNYRWSVVDFPEGESVLILDDGERRAAATDTTAMNQSFFLQNIFQPGRRTNTGIRPDVQTDQRILRDATPESLRKYSAIYLLDVEQLDDRSITNLEGFVREGGGLGIFTGNDVDPAYYNQRLYRDGTGLLPVPLLGTMLLPPDIDADQSDVQVADHPVFETFQGDRNPLLRRVRIAQYLRPAEDWQLPNDAPLRIAAKLRNQFPLAIEQQFGEGRVLVMLTTLAPQWNNWARDPSFVVVLLKLQSYLAAPHRNHPQYLVADGLNIPVDGNLYEEGVEFLAPTGLHATDRSVIKKPAQKLDPQDLLARATLDWQETQHMGIYDVVMTSRNGEQASNRFAVNVDARESDLTALDQEAVLAELSPVKPTYVRADRYEGGLVESSGINRSLMLMILLIALLIGEQWLAFNASYHPAKSGTTA